MTDPVNPQEVTEDGFPPEELIPVFLGTCGDCPIFLPDPLNETRGYCVLTPYQKQIAFGSCEVRRYQARQFSKAMKAALRLIECWGPPR